MEQNLKELWRLQILQVVYIFGPAKGKKYRNLKFLYKQLMTKFYASQFLIWFYFK